MLERRDSFGVGFYNHGNLMSTPQCHALFLGKKRETVGIEGWALPMIQKSHGCSSYWHVLWAKFVGIITSSLESSLLSQQKTPPNLVTRRTLGCSQQHSQQNSPPGVLEGPRLPLIPKRKNPFVPGAPKRPFWEMMDSHLTLHGFIILHQPWDICEFSTWDIYK